MIFGKPKSVAAAIASLTKAVEDLNRICDEQNKLATITEAE